MIKLKHKERKVERQTYYGSKTDDTSFSFKEIELGQFPDLKGRVEVVSRNPNHIYTWQWTVKELKTLQEGIGKYLKKVEDENGK